MSTPVLPLLGRGLAAGGAAGLAAGLFSLLAAEPLMDRAIRAEEARSGGTSQALKAVGEHTHDDATAVQHHEELFSRSTQHVGLVVSAVIAGLALGVLFAVAYALVHRRTPQTEPWRRALVFATAAFLAVSLLPGLRYPANPPGVGDSGTVSERQTLWLASIVIGVLGMLLAWQVSARLAERPAPVRHIAVALTVIAVLAAMFALPGNPDDVPVDATLLWNFRVLSLASHGVLWGVFGAVFGALGLRAAAGAVTGDTGTATAVGVR
jgi:predicted cobalt transporter CbtA